MKINEEKRAKFIESAGKRVNNVLHDMQILEPMARSSVYDFTKQDIEEMFCAMQESLDNLKAEFYKKFEEKARSEKKVFSFGAKANVASVEESEEYITAPAIETTTSTVAATEETTEVIPELTAVNEELATVTSSNDNLVF